MNIYFCGIGGVGLGPLAEIARDAGHNVFGSDLTESLTTAELERTNIKISYNQSGEFLKNIHNQNHIDWFIHTAALPDNHPELVTARNLGIRITKRHELLNHIIKENNLKLLSVAGTHGKTTTTAMLVWVLQKLNIPISYSIGSNIKFGPSGKFTKNSKYFVYECDEFDRNFLNFDPCLSIITSIDYDHPDTYPTKQLYIEAFNQFISQSNHTILWNHDSQNGIILPENSWALDNKEIVNFNLPGKYTRANATLVAKALEFLNIHDDNIIEIINDFPGATRRFEKLADNLYSDYGHHPIEIASTLQMARELSDDIVLIYQPHQNVRQYQLKNDYTDCMELASEIYWLPTYLTRENPNLEILTPKELSSNLTNKNKVKYAELDDDLWKTIESARSNGKLVIAMGAGTIDDWIRSRLR